MVLIFFWQCIEHHFVGMQWKSCTLCIIRHEGLQLCFGWLNWWIESLQSLVTPGFPMAKFGKTPSLHACYWLGIFSKSSPFSGFFKIHSKWCNLQIHPSPDPSRCARRAPCCQASAASTDMRSVGNSGSWGWIKSNCHMFGGMKINQDQLVWCELTHNIP